MIQYSKTIVFYNIYFTYMVPYAIANATRLGITAAQVTDLTAMKTAWDLAFEPYINPLTYGRFNIATINALWDTDHKYTNSLNQQLKNNPSLVLNPADYLLFGIHQDSKRRTNIPVPKAQAAVTFKATSHLNNEYHILDVAHPTHNAKPKDVDFAVVKLLIQSASAPPPSIDMLEVWGEVGSLNFDIPFVAEDEGKIAYVAVCFANGAGEAPFSEIIANPII